ncbi:hypothetical protein AB0B56_21045 [Streptosporangium canum]|uniref:hypothetical protein n=1 Tax=Streptosporangium canum TaxID=324952 RepID=UPI00341DA049
MEEFDRLWRVDDHCRYVRSGFVRYGTWSDAVSEKMFSEEQLEQLRSFPEISADELIRLRRALTRSDHLVRTR